MADRSNPLDVAAMDARIAGIGDWRGTVLAQVRKLIREALPDVVETMKWKKPSNPAGVPVWERAGTDKADGGIVCIADAFRGSGGKGSGGKGSGARGGGGKVKITFGNGAGLPDPAGLFNASLAGNAMRAIDLAEGETVDPEAFKALVRAAADAAAARRAGK